MSITIHRLIDDDVSYNTKFETPDPIVVSLQDARNKDDGTTPLTIDRIDVSIHAAAPFMAYLIESNKPIDALIHEPFIMTSSPLTDSKSYQAAKGVEGTVEGEYVAELHGKQFKLGTSGDETRNVFVVVAFSPFLKSNPRVVTEVSAVAKPGWKSGAVAGGAKKKGKGKKKGKAAAYVKNRIIRGKKKKSKKHGGGKKKKGKAGSYSKKKKGHACSGKSGSLSKKKKKSGKKPGHTDMEALFQKFEESKAKKEQELKKKLEREREKEELRENLRFVSELRNAQQRPSRRL